MLAKSFLILSLILITACSQPPIKVLDIPDFSKNFTQRYTVTDISTITVDSGISLPLNAVDGEVCMPNVQYLELKKWILKQQKGQSASSGSKSLIDPKSIP